MKALDLSGQWQLREATAADGQPIPARVPGDTYSALLAAERIPHPYWGTNELQVQWVGQRDWEYSRTFAVTDDLLQHTSVYLNADSLDTVAAISINGRHVTTSDNMFVRCRIEVKEYLHAGENEIRIRFTSPEKAALAANEKLPYPVPTSSAPVFSPHRNLLRKVPCHAGWDWGPCLMVSGIYGDIWLGATSQARIEYVYTEQKHARGSCEVLVTAEAFAVAAVTVPFDVSVDGTSVVNEVTLQPGYNLVHASVKLTKPKLWWPNGMGEQHLVDLRVSLAGELVEKRLGLRTIEVIDENDETGRSLWFRVNGRPIFCKGANWIPVDALPQRHTDDVYDELLTSAAAANMNMLRVWGGGQYEREAFYQLCDEKGLLIWHDFMFSCSLYPANPEFLASVRREAEHQVKRLRDHACIALWCGNNENVGALNWFPEARKNRDRYLVDYDRLNEGVLGHVVDAHDPTRRFWPSSPCGGRGDYSDCWHDDSRGDMHYWSVWHEGKSFDAYYQVTPRFCSEFGYQSFPSMDTIRSYAPEEEFNVTAPVMEHHQKNNRGNSLITEMFTRLFRVPEGFDNFIYLSQVQQALAIRMAVEYWRTLRPTCMGTLYWQLNDNWPVCSWASLEYGGKWKLLHYLARRFYAPVLPVVLQLDQESLQIRVVSDRADSCRAAFKLQLFSFEGEESWSDSWKQKVAGESASTMRTYKLDDLSPVRNQHFLRLTMTLGSEITTVEHLFTQFKSCYLAKAKVKTVVTSEGKSYRISVSTDKPAFFVTLNADGLRGEFSDNCIGLLPGETRELLFHPKEKVSVTQLRKALSVKHLRETYT